MIYKFIWPNHAQNLMMYTRSWIFNSACCYLFHLTCLYNISDVIKYLRLCYMLHFFMYIARVQNQNTSITKLKASVIFMAVK